MRSSINSTTLLNREEVKKDLVVYLEGILPTLGSKEYIIPLYSTNYPQVTISKAPGQKEGWSLYIQLEKTTEKEWVKCNTLMRGETYPEFLSDTIMRKAFDKNGFTRLPWIKETPVIDDTKETPATSTVKDGRGKIDQILSELSPEVRALLSAGTKVKAGETPAPEDMIMKLLMGGMAPNGGTDMAELFGTQTGKQVKAFIAGVGKEISGEDVGQGFIDFFGGINGVVEKISEKRAEAELEKIILGGGKEQRLILAEDVRLQIDEFVCLMNNSRNITNDHGIVIPKGYILQGPPGCGKTSIMKYVANTVDPEKVVVFRMEPSMYRSFLLSVGEKGFGKLLESIRDYAVRNDKHAVIFMDEFEDIATKRTNTHEAYGKELNVLLRFLDGLEDSKNITFIGATNAGIETLDPAVIRGGRCSHLIRLDKPKQDQVLEFVRVFFNQENRKQYVGVFDDVMFNDIFALNYSFGDVEEILNICLRKLYFRRIHGKNPNLRLGKEDISKAIDEFKSQRQHLEGYRK